MLTQGSISSPANSSDARQDPSLWLRMTRSRDAVGSRPQATYVRGSLPFSAAGELFHELSDGGEVEGALAGGVSGQDYVVGHGRGRHRHQQLVGQPEDQPEVFLHQGEGEGGGEIGLLADRNGFGGHHRRRS